jgi:hypothetical protein
MVLVDGCAKSAFLVTSDGPNALYRQREDLALGYMVRKWNEFIAA